MTRYTVVINREADRQKAQQFVAAAPWGARVELKAPKRTLPQNERLWAMLSDIAVQKEHFGRKYTPEVWKVLFMHEWQKEVELIPALNGREVVPLTRSSDLSKDEMTSLIEFMFAWGAENGVTFQDDKAAA